MFLQFYQRHLGFGKSSMIFQAFVAVAVIERNQHQTVLSVYPLQSIIDDQFSDSRSMEMSAASIADLSDGELRSAKFQLLSQPKKKYVQPLFSSTFFNLRSVYATKLSKYLTAIPNTSVRR